MKNLAQTFAFAGAAIVLSLAATATPAEASHGKFCYQGKCHGFHGEAHVIEALRLMDEALLVDCPRAQSRIIISAQREIMAAFREFCQYRAKHQLVKAKIELSRFLATRDPGHLDHAALHLNEALLIEQRVHARLGVQQIGHQNVIHKPVVRYPRPAVHRYSAPTCRGNICTPQINFGGSRYSIGFRIR